MPEILTFDFMQNAIMAGLLASVACGVIGSLVTVNRLVFLAGGVAHTAYGGVGLAFYLGCPVLPCTVGFTLGASLIMGAVTVNRSERSDTFIGVMWAAGMALGIILLDLTPGYTADLMSYLFGSILAVPASDLWIMLGLDAVILAVVVSKFKDFTAMSFDREFARASGMPVRMLHFVLLAMIAVSVVIIIRVVGLILVIALLTIPPHLAERRATSLAGMIPSAVLWSAFFCLSGLAAAYVFDITSGASIIASAVVCYALVAGYDWMRGRR